ncbi:DUF1015 domain-containing protein [Enterococcus bulliens]
MVQVRPFRAIRPKEELAKEVAVLPYDVVDSQEAKEYAKGNPYSYFHIDRAEIDLDDLESPYEARVYEKAAANLAKFLENGWLKQEEEAAYYLYRLTMNGRKQTGIVATTSIQEYLDGKIKKHEYTRPEKEVDRMNHIRACDADTSPIFLSYRQTKPLETIMKEWPQTHVPLYRFTSFYEVTHEVWAIDDASVIAQIEAAFAEVPALYIADGHHRTESAVKIGLEKREQGTATPESEAFLAILFPETELAIYEYNRIINVPVEKAQLFEHLAKVFEINEIGYQKPSKKGEINLLIADTWYQLVVKEALRSSDPAASLDVAYLQEHVLTPLFGIEDVRTDKRIDFVGGIRGEQELEKKVASPDWVLAFEMYPTQMSDLLGVADAGEIMPPKSTWFEPKLLSGLFVYSLA